MAVKVKKTKATSRSTMAEIDFLSDVEADRETKTEIAREVADYLTEQTLKEVGEAKSPVSGERFPALSKSYASFKQTSGRKPIANLEFTGAMLDDFRARPTRNGVEIGWINSNQAEKADGHANFSGESDLPKRRAIPDQGQRYKRRIESDIENIVADKIAEGKELSRAELGQVRTKREFWDVMKRRFPELTRSQIRGAVLRNAGVSQILGEFNLLRFLNGEG